MAGVEEVGVGVLEVQEEEVQEVVAAVPVEAEPEEAAGRPIGITPI